MISDYFADDNEPIKCTKCKSHRIISFVKDRLNGIVCEELYECGNCGSPLGYWAYGHFEPIYKEEYIRKCGLTDVWLGNIEYK